MTSDEEMVNKKVVLVGARHLKLAQMILSAFLPEERLAVAEVLVAGSESERFEQTTLELKRYVGVHDEALIAGLVRTCKNLRLRLPAPEDQGRPSTKPQGRRRMHRRRG